MNIRDRKSIERPFTIQARALETENGAQELWVEGRAIVFNSPTVLFTMNNEDYSETVDRSALDECNMTDVIFNYNHGGKVLARTRNKTLTLEKREDGLYIRARLDGTEEGRKLYEEITGGYIDRMSFQFSIEEEDYDEDSRMWTIRKIKRLYDVSAVDIPAYDDTFISARRADAEAKLLESQRDAEALAALRLKTLIKSKL